MMHRRRWLIGAAGAALLAVPSGVRAQGGWPSRPIRLLVGFAPGGTTDLAARIVAQRLGAALGQPVVVENRTGASGTLAGEAVARAAPDGHTLLLGSSSTHGSVRSLYRSVPYDPAQDFAPVSLVAHAQSVVLVNAALPVTSLRGLIEHARAHPGALHYGSAGMGTYHHMAGALFASMAGLDMVHVPYRGGSPAMNALLSGEVQVGFQPIAEVGSNAEGGRIRVVGAVGSRRLGMFPSLEAIAEVLPGYDVPLWVGLFAPAGTPPAITGLLQARLAEAMRIPEVQAAFAQIGFDPVASTPAEFDAVVRRGLETWPDIVRVSGARLE